MGCEYTFPQRQKCTRRPEGVYGRAETCLSGGRRRRGLSCGRDQGGGDTGYHSHVSSGSRIGGTGLTVQKTSLRITSPTSSPTPLPPPAYSASAASNTLGPASEKYGFAGLSALGTRNESHVWNRGFSGRTHASGCTQRSSLGSVENEPPSEEDGAVDSAGGWL